MRDQLKYIQNYKSNPIIQKGQRVSKKEGIACATKYHADMEPTEKERSSNSHEDIVRLFMLLFVPQVLELISYNNLDTVIYQTSRKLVKSITISLKIDIHLLNKIIRHYFSCRIY